MIGPVNSGFDLQPEGLSSEGSARPMYVPKPSDLTAGGAATDALELCVGDAFGVGVRSRVAFGKGEVLDHFDGRIERHVTQHSLQIGPDSHISETRFVGYLSHGCDPNCALDMEARQLVALTDIVAGELLRIDYAATEDTLYADFDCSCGASNCRGRITGRLGPSTS